MVSPLEISATSDIRVRISWMENWWFTLMEGRGLVHVRGNDASTGQNYALLWLTLSGQNRPSGSQLALPRPGEMALLQWEEPAGVISDGEFRYLIAHIPISSLHAAASTEGDMIFGRPIPALVGPGAVLATALRTMASEAGRHANREALAMVLPQFAQLLLRTFEVQHAMPVERPRPSDHLARIRSYIEAHLTDPELHSAQVARGCSLSNRQFFRAFSSGTESFSCTLRQLRVERACDLIILYPGMPIAEIARSTGFKSAAHFCRVFHRSIGTPPTSYRRNQMACRTASGHDAPNVSAN